VIFLGIHEDDRNAINIPLVHLHDMAISKKKEATLNAGKMHIFDLINNDQSRVHPSTNYRQATSTCHIMTSEQSPGMPCISSFISISCHKIVVEEMKIHVVQTGFRCEHRIVEEEKYNSLYPVCVCGVLR
jgi:hypothetical protein